MEMIVRSHLGTHSTQAGMRLTKDAGVGGPRQVVADEDGRLRHADAKDAQRQEPRGIAQLGGEIALLRTSHGVSSFHHISC
jgi:hypothetical protein